MTRMPDEYPDRPRNPRKPGRHDKPAADLPPTARKILAYLEDADYGETATTITENLAISRPTVDKYLKILQAENEVITREVGRSIVYIHPRRSQNTPILQMYAQLHEELERTVLPSMAPAEARAFLRRMGTQLAPQFSLPEQAHVHPLKGFDLQYEHLQHLAQVSIDLLRQLEIFRGSTCEVIPPLGGSTPRSLLVRVENPDGFSPGIVNHYIMVAALIEAKLRARTGVELNFSVNKARENALFFEIGFVDRYVLDLSIQYQREATIPARDHLERVKAHFSQYFTFEFREYTEAGVLHYELNLRRNRDLEEYAAFYARVVTNNCHHFKALGLQSDREYLPRADWPGPPYLVLTIQTNFGQLARAYLQEAGEARRLMGYNLHVSPIHAGLVIDFMEPLDFETFTLIAINEEAVRADYARYGITNEEYFQRRLAGIIQIKQDLAREKRLARKRKRQQRKQQYAGN